MLNYTYLYPVLFNKLTIHTLYLTREVGRTMSLIKLKNQPKRERRKKILIAVFAVAILLGLSVGFNLNFLSQGPLKIFTETQTTPVYNINGENGSVTGLYQQTSESVVLVEVISQVGSLQTGGQGSGFVYSSDGYIITNNHVVEGADSITVTFPDWGYKQADFVGADAYSDLAVVKVNMTGLRPIPLGSIEDLQPGQTVLAIGNPFGLEGTITKGIVSQKDRLLDTEAGFTIPNVIQTDAAINPGNSGGPLITLEGKVIGVNTAIQSGTGTWIGIGFAISVETVKRVVPELIDKGYYQHSWIGIRGRTVTPQIAEAMETDQEKGVLVVEVTPGGPADKSGLQIGSQTAVLGGVQMNIGGDIITSIKGEEILDLEDLVSSLAQNTQPNEEIEVGIVRNNKETTVSLTLGERPQP